MTKALGLISGGLDSMLAALILRRAGVEVVGVTFTTPFFGASKARKACSAQSIPLTILEVGREHLETVVKNPRYGYGANMNPCIDCHAYMLKKAAGVLDKRGLDFIFTGEVLGQRPMSQNRQALNSVANLSGRPDLVLRPLSARCLPASQVEEAGLVDREQLLDLQGRGRKRQMALAAELGVTEYPSPAGGCLLTEPGFCRRLKDLLDHDPGAGLELVELLKTGRHLRLSPRAKLVLGRKQAENQVLEKLAPPNSRKMTALGVPGPLGVYLGPEEGPELLLAASLVAGYAKTRPGESIGVEIEDGPVVTVEAMPKRLAQPYLI